MERKKGKKKENKTEIQKIANKKINIKKYI